MPNDDSSPAIDRTSEAESTHPRVYSAPRRFDIFTLMVVTVAYAFLFMLTSALGTIEKNLPVWISTFIGLFLAYVAVAQLFLFKGQYPRLASILAGITAVAFWLLMFVVRLSNPIVAPYDLAWGALCSCIMGVPIGYLAGATVGGVFLISDVLRRKVLNRQSKSNEIGEDESR